MLYIGNLRTQASRQFIGLVAGFFLVASSLHAQLVINEIHYHPPDKTERSQFVELVNADTVSVDISGWSLAGDIQYKFPAGSTVNPHAYVVVAQDTAVLLQKFNAHAMGQFTGHLSARNGVVKLVTDTGTVVNEVDYQEGFPWPTVGDLPGYSIELINPDLDNTLGGSWRASAKATPSVGSKSNLILPHSEWKYLKGLQEASNPTSLWRELDFADDSWQTGTAPIGYDPTEVMGTTLNDMRNSYSSVYFRKTFVVEDPNQIGSLVFNVMYDDGFDVWINGQNILRQNVPFGDPAYNDTATGTRETGSYDAFSGPVPAGLLTAGTNIIAVHAFNVSLGGSSDFFFDLSMQSDSSSAPGSSGPTPGAQNFVFATNAPPQIRQVAHQPETPTSGQPVRITAKITDPDLVAQVTLAYQIVDPGAYIELTDAAFQTNWVTVPMNDAGTDGDEIAGDSIFTATLPASLQTHRRLIRYRISAQDSLGLEVTVPYADDPQPNFAYFVYDGAPAWRAAIEPGSTDQGRASIVEYGTNVMNRLPIYHLISKQNSVEHATWLDRYDGSEYKWSGALVYDGKVYDHIHYRSRGGVWRYSMVKNMWKFDFNRGHDFQARDNYGNKYKTSWTKLNLGACIQQGDYLHRGEQGMFEAVGWRLFNLAGLESSKTHYIEFRVVDNATEANATNQYEGDFWGLYLALEQNDGRFLDEHNLPDGNYYKMEGGFGTLNNQGATAVTDSSDLRAFINTYQQNPTDDWWRTNFDRERYYNFRTIVEAIHHYDIDEGAGKNYYYYLNPETKLWSIHAWDLDLTWADNMYGGGSSPFVYRVLPRPAFNLEYRNRIRELRDLLFNVNQTGKLIDEYAAVIYDISGAPCIASADRAMWDYNPKMSSSTYSSSLSKAGKGLFYKFPLEPEVPKSFVGTIQLMKNYIATRCAVLDGLAEDSAIPSKPVVTYTGLTNYPANRLSFQCSAFSGNGGQFAAMQWRLAQITPANQAAGAVPFKYEINADWDSGELAGFLEQLQLDPAQVKVGHLYRVRARFKDTTGRWSHWSAPVEFTVGDSDNAARLVQDLRLTELMYHSPMGSDYDYIELHNANASEPLDLNGACFVKGIDYTFGTNAVIPPNGYLVLAKATNAVTFRDYYGVPSSALVVGPYSGNLDNGGETLTLKSALNGVVIFDFTYRDAHGWPVTADGVGDSLVFTADALAHGGSLAYGGSWRASSAFKGSPGAADPEISGGLLINEIKLTANAAVEGWIELYNPGPDSKAFDNYYLSDDALMLKKWALPAGSLGPRQRIGFSDKESLYLNSSGGTLYLSYLPGNNQDHIVDAADFRNQPVNSTWGRYPDGSEYWQNLQPTRAAANQPQSPALLIDQIMFRPAFGATNTAGDGEYIALFNPAPITVALGGTNGAWRIAGDVSYLFPTNATIPAKSLVFITGFDPNKAVQLAAFKNLYGAGAQSISVYGPFSGALNTNGGRITLESTSGFNASGLPTDWVMVDEVVYSDAWPWPSFTGQEGKVLARADLSLPGADPSRWALMAPFFTISSLPTIQLHVLSPAVPGELHLQVKGASTGQLSIDRSVNCTDWTPVFTNSVSNGVVDYVEKPGATAQAWFYRARWNP